MCSEVKNEIVGAQTLFMSGILASLIRLLAMSYY